MLTLLIIGCVMVVVFMYASIAVAISRALHTNHPFEGSNCSNCRKGTARGRSCWHWEHNQGDCLGNLTAKAAFWLPVYSGLLMWFLVTHMAALLAFGPRKVGGVLAGRAVRARELERDRVTREERIAALEKEAGLADV